MLKNDHFDTDLKHKGPWEKKIKVQTKTLVKDKIPKVHFELIFEICESSF